MRRLSFVLLVLVLIVSGVVTAGCGSNDIDSEKEDGLSEAPEVIALKAGHSQAPDHPFHGTLEHFAELVNEKTAGAVEITIFPNSQLGNEATMLDSVSMGTLDILMANPSNTASRVPELLLVNVCYLFEDQAHLERVVNDEKIFNDYAQIVKDKNQGITLLNIMGNGARHVYANRAIDSPEELKGLKIRVMPSDLDQRVWTAIGTSPDTVEFSEVYTALQTHMMDAAENTVSSYAASKHYEVAPHLILTDHQWLMTQLWASDKTLEKLPPEYADAIKEAAIETVPFAVELQVKTDADFLDKLVEEGKITVHEIDRAPLIECVRPLQDDVAEELGVKNILGRIRELR